MRGIRRLISATVPALFLCCSAISAPAWEFELTGSFNWAYEFYSQRGSRGFFGPYDVDNGGATLAGNLNFWNGGRFDTNIITSSRGGWSYFNVEFWPTIKLNQAIRFQGKYRLGTWGNPWASDYYTFDAPGIHNAFSEGQWTMFWATAQTPLGVFGLGKRPWMFGTGLQYDGADSATTESMSLVAPFGPFDIGIAFYPYRFAGSSSILAFTAYDPFVNAVVPFDPFDLPRFTTASGARVVGQYFSRADSSGALGKDYLVFLHYSSGPVNFGVIGSFLAFHIGPEAVLQTPGDPAAIPALDCELTHGSAYVKYNNGSLFLNAEGAWIYWTDRWSDPAAIVGPPNPLYIEQWRCVVEAGAIQGPAKISVLSAWTPGPDRRRGILIDRQPAAFVRHRTFDSIHGNSDVFRPYSYIFAYDYGAGLGAYNLSRDGYVRDAFVLAVRLDYALAANLNIFGSFFYANRTSHGYSWGCIGPNAGGGFTPFGTAPGANISIALNRYPASPNIPDTSLGHEIDLGFDWKLLEGLTGGVLLGYWQPGKWFNYACIDRSVPGWHTGVTGNFFGTRPDRSLDPIVGGTFYLKYEF